MQRPGVRRAAGLTVAGLVLGARTLAACPVCHSELGSQIRAGIIGDNLDAALLAIGVPFSVLAGVVLGLRQCLRRRRRTGP
jgi:hypothetical protein